MATIYNVIRWADNAQELDKHLRDTLGTVEKMTAQTTKMVNSLSGEKIVKEAKLMADAIARIGDVSKLTETSQARVNKQMNEAIGVYRVLGKDPPETFIKLEAATRQVAAATTKAAAATQGLGTALDHAQTAAGGLSARAVALGSAIGNFLGHVAYDGVKRLGNELLAIATNGLKLAPTVSGFHALARAIGESGDAMVTSTRSATKGLISDLDIMAASNKAMLLGLPVTSASMATMAQTAVVLGRAMKLDAATALDTLTIALGRSSALRLDDLGLSLSQTDANARYAAQLGIVGRELTDAEKKMAFYTAAMETAKQKVAELGGLQLTLPERIQQIEKAFKNFTDALGVAIATSPVVLEAVGGVADGIQQAFGSNQTVLVQKLTGYVNDAALAMVDMAEAGVQASGFLMKEYYALLKVWGDLTQVVDGVRLALLYLQRTQATGFMGNADLTAWKQLDEQIGSLLLTMKERGDTLQTYSRQQTEVDHGTRGFSESLAQLRTRLIEASTKHADVAVVAEQLARAQQKAGGAAALAGDAQKKAAEVTKKSIEATAAAWDDYFALRDQATEDSLTVALRAADRWFEAERRKLDQTKALNANYYQEISALEAVHGLKREQAEQAFIVDAMRWWAEYSATIERELEKSSGFVQGFYVGLRNELKGVGEITIETPEQYQRRRDEEDRRAGLADDALRNQFYGPTLEQLGAADRSAMDALREWSASLTQLAQVSGDTFSGMVQDVARIVAAYKLASEAADNYARADDTSGQALALVQGATAVWSATGQGSRGARIAGGALTGAKIGSVIPGVGTAVGAGVGAAVGYLRSLSVTKEEREGRAAFAEIEAQYGGFEGLLARVGSAYDAMGRSSREAQDDVANLMDVTRAGGPAVQGTWEEINRVIQEHEQLIARVDTGIGNLAAAMDAAGGQLPTAFRPLVEQLLEIGNLTDAQRDKLRGLLDQGPDFDRLQQDAAKYGISLEQLGPKFQQAALDKTGAEYAATFQRLIDAGGDFNGIVTGFADEYSQFAQDAIKYNAAIPESMRPVLEHMAATGLLLDENGVKITDLSGLTFKETPLDKSSQAIVSAIDQLRELFEKMPGVANTMAKGVGDALSRIPDRNVRVNFVTSGMPDGSGSNDTTIFASRGVIVGPWLRPQYFKDGGFPWVPKGLDTIPAMLRKHEMVLTPEHQRVVGALLRQAPGHDDGAGAAAVVDFSEMKRELAATRQEIKALRTDQRRQGAEYAERLSEVLKSTRLRIA